MENNMSNSENIPLIDVRTIAPQERHPRIFGVLTALAPGGMILFSNNFRRFQLDTAGLEGLSVRDISASTIPFDFERNTRIHRAWELRRA